MPWQPPTVVYVCDAVETNDTASVVIHTSHVVDSCSIVSQRYTARYQVENRPQFTVTHTPAHLHKMEGSQ